MKSNFHEKRAWKIERFQELAEKNDSVSSMRYGVAKEIGSWIPMGQPILVGHHSEKRHRAALQKIDNNMRKSVEASEKAEHYRQKVQSLLNGTAISSDDPDAIDKLQEKLERLELLQDIMKKSNKIIKSKKADVEKVAALVELGMQEATAIKLMEKGVGWNNQPGFPSYRLTNNNANIRRIKERIAYLERQSKIQSSEEEFPGGITLNVSQEDNRVQIFFPGKPEEAIRTRLKSSGFRWAPSVGAWQAYLNNWNIDRAKSILSSL